MAERIASEVNQLRKREIIKDAGRDERTDERRSRFYWKWFQKLKALRNQAANL